MNKHINNNKIKNVKITVVIISYLVAAMLICAFVANLCRADIIYINATEPGITDLREFDFTHSIARPTGGEGAYVIFYPGAFYTAEDFANGSIEPGIPYTTDMGPHGNFGTQRMVLRLPPGQVYAIAMKNASYAQRLFIDGKEYTSAGIPGDSAETTLPKTLRYVEAFMPTGDTTEIIIHYANFVHADGGSIYPMDIGLAGNITRGEQLIAVRETAVDTALAVAMLFFIGLFLLFSQNTYLLWFGLICGCISLRSLFVGNKIIMTLLPDLDWYLAIRLEYIFTIGVILFTGLYLGGLFPAGHRKKLTAASTAVCLGAMAFICLVQPMIFTMYVTLTLLVCSVPVVCILLSVLIDAIRNKLTSHLSHTECLVLFVGLIIYTVLSLANIYAHGASLLLFSLDYDKVGGLALMLINMLVLTLGFSRTEQELHRAKANEREILETNKMLERLSHIKTEFLAGISHEMKTPLTVISNSAEVTRAQFEADATDEETLDMLSDIAAEAQRLGRLVEQLLRVAVDRQERLGFERVSIAEILRLAEATEPILAKNKNWLETEIPTGLPDILANKELIAQVLMNILTNANRHCKNQPITLSVQRDDDSFVRIIVSDKGDGISPELLPHIFHWGESGDGGTGYGLAISKDIIDTHGGRIKARSEMGKGTSILFTLPVYTEETP